MLLTMKQGLGEKENKIREVSKGRGGVDVQYKYRDLEN